MKKNILFIKDLLYEGVKTDFDAFIFNRGAF